MIVLTVNFCCVMTRFTSSVDVVSDSNCVFCFFFLLEYVDISLLVWSCHCSLLDTCLNECIVIIVMDGVYSSYLVLIHAYLLNHKRSHFPF